MQALHEICALVLSVLEKKYSRTIYELWFKDLVLENMTEHDAIFSIDNDFKCGILTNKYESAIESAIEEIVGFPLKVGIFSTEKSQKDFSGGFVTPFSTPPKKEEEVDESEKEPELSVTIENPGIVEKYTFENFIEGESNKFAKAASMAVAKNPFNTYNPLFIYGQSGLGKTHLLYAITNEIKKVHPGVKIIYKKGEDFTNELIAAIQNSATEEFHRKYRNADVLLIDDIQFIAGKESTQEAFFHTFNALYENEKQIILTSDRPPKDIKLLEDRLRTRFEWGLVADVQPPSLELRTAIICKKAETLPSPLSKEIVDYLASTLKENVRQIEGVIKKIAAVSVLSATPITRPMCERIVKEFTTGTIPPAMMVDSILNETSEKFGISVEEIKGRRRSGDIATARHVAIYLIHTLTDYSLNAIGDIFDRDHTTVMSSINKIEEDKEKDQKLESAINEIMAKLKD